MTTADARIARARTLVPAVALSAMLACAPNTPAAPTPTAAPTTPGRAETTARAAQQANAGARTQPDSIVFADATLHGTLELPPASCDRRSYPVALIIAGSGPTDRDGNSALLPGDNNSLRLLAEGLAAECIASLRYDKRGIGESAAPGLREADLRFTTYSDDAAAWIEHLRDDERFDDVVVIGHSEGALLGTLAAREADADGLVLISGAGRPVGEVLREQVRASAADTLYAQVDSLLTELEAGRTIPNPPPALMALFRPSVQPYMISWLPIDPAEELARVDVPALVVWGTSDMQASRADAERLAAADDDVRLVVIEGMNHVLKSTPADPQAQRASYSDPTLPLADGLVDAIVDYIDETVDDS